MKIRIFITFGLIFAFLFFCVSCSFNETYDKAEEHSDMIITCMKEKDVTTLKEMFCPYININHNLEDEIEKAFEFFDGEIVSDGDKHFLEEAGGTTENGKTITSRIQPKIRHIKTDSEKEYEIVFNEYLINDDNPDYIGITRITITNEDGVKYMIGEIIPA